MGCFLFQQGGLGRFRAPSPSRGLPQALASSSAMAAEEPQSWVQHGCVTGRALLGTLTAWDRQAGSCLSPLAAQTPAPAAAGKPCSKNPAQTLQQKLHSHSSAAHCRAVHTELPAGFLSPFSPGCPYRGEGTKCCCALLRWVMVPKGGADTDKAPRNSPAASSTFLFPNQFKHSHFSSGRCF